MISTKQNPKCLSIEDSHLILSGKLAKYATASMNRHPNSLLQNRKLNIRILTLKILNRINQ